MKKKWSKATGNCSLEHKHFWQQPYTNLNNFRPLFSTLIPNFPSQHQCFLRKGLEVSWKTMPTTLNPRYAFNHIDALMQHKSLLDHAPVSPFFISWTLFLRGKTKNVLLKMTTALRLAFPFFRYSYLYYHSHYCLLENAQLCYHSKYRCT